MEYSSQHPSTAENKCIRCIHNIGSTVMDCEYACAGVEKIADDGLIVVSCIDYRPRPNHKRKGV